jgi:hypothetical protein
MKLVLRLLKAWRERAGDRPFTPRASLALDRVIVWLEGGGR